MSLKKPLIYDVAGGGSVLATRDAGKRTGREAADQLSNVDAMVLSFSGVEVASTTFLDEMLRGLRSVLMGGGSQKIIIAAGLNEDVREAIEMVLVRTGGAMAEMTDDQVRLLGGSAQLQKTLEEAARTDSFTARDLAERLEVKLPNLHARLKQLAEAGAIARSESSTETRQEGGRPAATYCAAGRVVTTG